MANEILISEILRKLAQAIGAEDAAMLSEVHSVLFHPKKPTRKPAETPKPPAKPTPGEAEIGQPSALHAEFARFESREALETFIVDRYRTKVAITALAKTLKVHTTKQDKLGAVVGKIVDATLGYAVRQKTIRGE